MLTKKTVLSIISLCFVALQANQTEQSSFKGDDMGREAKHCAASVFIPKRLGNIILAHDGLNFHIEKKR